ncbi:MAG: hypothetical protein JW892_17765 [Anaerolineae bacterium]|nr:hypothetical protein [Anaerolineae bacterium]
MDWLNTLIDVTTLAITANNAVQLSDMKRQGAAATTMQAIVSALRNDIFKFKSTAETILELEMTRPVIAAAAMKLLEERLGDSRITPDLFLELGDKEYAKSTLKLIHTNGERLMEQLSLPEQAEITELVRLVSPMDDYSYYLGLYNEGKRLAEAVQIIETYGPRNGCLIWILSELYFFPGFIVPALSQFLVPDSSAAIRAIVVIGSYVIWGYGLLRLLRWRSAWKLKRAKKTVKELGGTIDIERFMQLDDRFAGQSREQIQQKLEEGQMAFQAFFGDDLMRLSG